MKTNLVSPPVDPRLKIRAPDPATDLDRLIEFLSTLPQEQRLCLRYDVTGAAGTKARLAQIDGRNCFRLVAEVDGRIVGDATLDRQPYFWSRHVAELRCVISPDGERLGVGPCLLHEMVSLGHQARDIEILFTELMPEQTDAIAMMAQAGFVREGSRKRFAKDVLGNYHDLVVMSNDLEAVWRTIEQQIQDQDTPSFSGQ